MSVSYTAYLVHGVVLPARALSGPSRGCSHPELLSKFCPQCGKAMWATESIRESLQMSQASRVGDIGWIQPEGADTYVVGIVLAALDSLDNPWHQPVQKQLEFKPNARDLDTLHALLSQLGSSTDAAVLQFVFVSG